MNSAEELEVGGVLVWREGRRTGAVVVVYRERPRVHARGVRRGVEGEPRAVDEGLHLRGLHAVRVVHVVHVQHRRRVRRVGRRAPENIYSNEWTL